MIGNLSMREFAKWASDCFLFLNLGHQNIQSNAATSFITLDARTMRYLYVPAGVDVFLTADPYK